MKTFNFNNSNKQNQNVFTKQKIKKPNYNQEAIINSKFLLINKYLKKCNNSLKKINLNSQMILLS